MLINTITYCIGFSILAMSINFSLTTMAAMLSIFIFFFSLPYMALSNSFTFSKIQLPTKVTGPESAAFDAKRVGPYVSVTDGRILKWLGPNVGFVEFAFTAPNRNKTLCDGTTNPDLGPICGRPLGLSFYSRTGELYIVDAYFGFLVIGPNGGLATQLATGAEGVRFKFLNGVDVDQLTGIVYFSAASEKFELRNVTQPNFGDDSTGKLLKYDPSTKQVTVLLRGLAFAGGPALSADRTFVLVSEYLGKRIQKYWLAGFKAYTAEIFADLNGNPLKIKRAEKFGDFWVAVQVITQQPVRFTSPQGVRINSFGTVQQNVSFATQYNNASVTVVQEQNGALYTGSRHVDFVGVYKLY